MDLNDVISRCENSPLTEERKMILALAKELQGSRSKSKSQGKSQGSQKDADSE